MVIMSPHKSTGGGPSMLEFGVLGWQIAGGGSTTNGKIGVGASEIVD